MKAVLEIVMLNAKDIVATSAPCTVGYTPIISGGCEDPDVD